MSFEFDEPPQHRRRRCPDCGGDQESTWGFVHRDGDLYAAYWSAWYPHENDAYVDVTIGSWKGPDYPDHVMFGCRIGLVEGEEGPRCTLVQAGRVLGDGPMLGRKLTREDALAHRW